MSAKALFRLSFLIFSVIFMAPVFAGENGHEQEKVPFNPGRNDPQPHWR